MSPDRMGKLQEAIRLGRQAASCKDFLQSLLASRRQSLLDELESDGMTSEEVVRVQGRIQELHMLERLLESIAHTAKLAEEEIRDE